MRAIDVVRRWVGAWTLGAVLVAGCHGQPRAPAAPPSAEVRVAAAMAAWGQALQDGDDDAVSRLEDGGGRVALVYVALKAAASQVDGGAAAIETTVSGTVLLVVIMSLWPGIFGAYPDDEVLLVLPAGRLGSALVAADLATAADGTEHGLAIVPVSRDQTLGRLQTASAHHRQRLRERAAWTCQPARLERTIAASEPSLVRAARLSTNIFAEWLADLDAIWLVRADCTSGPALFIVTGHLDPKTGATRDLILATVLAP